MKCPICLTIRVSKFSSSAGTFYRCENYRCKASWREGEEHESKLTSKLTRKEWMMDLDQFARAVRELLEIECDSGRGILYGCEEKGIVVHGDGIRVASVLCPDDSEFYIIMMKKGE